MKNNAFLKTICWLTLAAFSWTSIVPSHAQGLVLPAPGSMVGVSAPVAPLVLRGIKVDADDPLHMDFILGQGTKELAPEELEVESRRLLGYFLASLTIPEKDMWVNLSPYEDERIVQDDLGRTGMGRDLLAQDYILKQLASSLSHPDEATGKAFWAEVYRRAYAQFGTTDVPGLDAQSKVWIVPGKAVVYEARSPDGKQISAYVDTTHLNVMLDADRLAEGPANDAATELGRQVMREVIIPVIERDVNEGANFAPLRQIYHSMVLSYWLKKKLLTSVAQTMEGARPAGAFAGVFINKHKTAGNEIADPSGEKQRIYDQYLGAFRKGAYNFIREEVDLYSRELIPRKYFSGGFSGGDMQEAVEIRDMAQGERPVIKQRWNADGERVVTVEWQVASPKRQRPLGKMIRTAAIALTIASAVGLGGYYFFGRQPDAKQKVEVRVDTYLVANDVVSAVSRITESYYEFEKVTLKGRTYKIDDLRFLAGTMGETIPKGLDNDGRAKMMQRLAEKMAGMMQKYFDDFAPGFKEIGMTSKDLMELILSMVMKESHGDLRAAQAHRSTRAQALGAAQIEYATYRGLLRAAEKALRNKPGYEDMYARVQREIGRQDLGNVKQNVWLHVSPDNEVVQLDFHFLLVVSGLQNMLLQTPFVPDLEMYRALVPGLKKYSIEIPDAVSSVGDSNLSLMEMIVMKSKMYPDLEMKDIVGMIMSAAWNRGPNLGPRHIDAMLAYGTADDRPAYLGELLAQRKLQERARVAAAGALKAFLGQDLGWGKGKTDLLLVYNDRLADQFEKALEALPSDGARRKFTQIYVKYLGARSDLQRIGSFEGMDYAFPVVNAVQDDVGKKFDPKDSLKTKELLKAAKKDNSQIADNLGGIDLTDQAQGFEARGDAGAFGLDFSSQNTAQLDREVAGFSPRILSIRPAGDVMTFLGFAQ